MSTTTNLEVALRYSAGGATSLLFKLHTASFMERGASIEFVSAFPAESEWLFPPMTYLRPSGKTLTARCGATEVTVVEVVPNLS
jgi:hypothetical protein